MHQRNESDIDALIKEIGGEADDDPLREIQRLGNLEFETERDNTDDYKLKSKRQIHQRRAQRRNPKEGE